MSASPKLMRTLVHPDYLSGPILEAALSDVAIGEICMVRRHWRDALPVARAQVVGFRRDIAVLCLLGDSRGMSRESVLVPTGAGLNVFIDDRMIGAVLDATGEEVGRVAAPPVTDLPGRLCALDAEPPSFQQRVPIVQMLPTGVRAIDGLLTCGIGQRMGIFAPAGAGKTSLVNMLVESGSADIFVIGLIGERGREVVEFVEQMQKSVHAHRCVIVQATSDASSIDRCNAALLATTIAEHHRDRGKNVLLIQDSLTRYARALRDVALAAGEPPVRRGYPASVFEALPRLLERPGVTARGSITAFYTVLLESDDDVDPIAEEIRSILDGHIYLSRKLAARSHYPAIDVLRSLSRVAGQICAPEQLRAAGQIREKLGRLEELQLMLDLGEYRAGEHPTNDALLRQKDELMAWLRQRHGSIAIPPEELIKQMVQLAS